MMKALSAKDLAESIKRIKSYLFDANHHFYRSQNIPDGNNNEYDQMCQYTIERAFICTLVLLETHGLKDTYNKVDLLFSQATEEGFSKSLMGVEDLYLVWAAYLDDYLDAIALTYNLDLERGVVTADILSVLRATQYTITDTELFGSPPANESDVHLRIEGFLKCLFPDLKHKPRLTKPIKNFEPDTGLPSIKTLIEYKFISNKNDCKTIADQILADTRGYISREWDRFIYVIYETTRIKPEGEWKDLLYECNVQDADIIVISGIPVNKPSSNLLKKGKGRVTSSN